MKVKKFINGIMSEKEVAEEKEELSLISYDGMNALLKIVVIR